METEQLVYRESKARSLLKGLTWRILATLTTVIIAYILTGEVETALHIGSIEFVTKFAIYYVHERAWQLIPRGTVRQIGHHQEP